MNKELQKYFNLINTKMIFLESYGFDVEHPICSDCCYITYFSDKYFVQWSCGVPECEISIVVGKTDLQGKGCSVPACSIGMLIELDEFVGWSFPRNEGEKVVAADNHSDYIDSYTLFLEKYANILFTDSSEKIYLKCLEKMKGRVLKEEVKYSKLKMNKAWRDKESKKYIKLANELGDNLTTLERKRYNFLVQRINGR